MKLSAISHQSSAVSSRTTHHASRLASLLLCSFALNSFAADIITATVSVTNAAGTTNGQTITVNGNVRTWTNSVFTPASHILTNSTPTGSATNLFLQVAATPYTGLYLSRSASTNITLQTSPDGPLTVALSAGWGTVTYSTQTLTTARAVRVPLSVESSGNRALMSSQLVQGINDYATNSFFENATAVANLVGLTNDQTVAGIKMLTNAAGQWFGIVSNSPAISGTVVFATNGLYRSPILNDSTFTNGTYYGNHTFADFIDISGNLGFDGYASYISADGVAFYLQPETSDQITLGTFEASYVGISTYDGRFTNTVRVGTLHATNTIHYKGTLFASTNTFPAGSDIAFGRHAVSSLANGNNAAVPVGTNVFVEVSGPSSAFTLNGINGSPNRDGKLLVILNQTGQNMTVAHDSGVDATAANRIYTMTGADRVTTGNGAATFIYSGAAARWILISLDQ